MDKLNIFLLTLLILENGLLVVLTFLWTNRHCSKCGKVKCIERILSKTCSDCKEQTKRTIQL